GQVRKHRSIRGEIRYISNQPERLGQERGREYFTLTQQADGNRVMLAHCEIDDEPNVIRDVSLGMDARFRPLDCSVRLTVGDRFEGSGWMCVHDTYAECETYNRRDGRITQRMPLSEPCRWLQAHPIAGDGLLMSHYDLARGAG